MHQILLPLLAANSYKLPIIQDIQNGKLLVTKWQTNCLTHFFQMPYLG